MDRGELIARCPLAEVPKDADRIALIEIERISRLRQDVDTNHIEARSVVPNRGSPGTTKQVEEQRPAHRTSTTSSPA
jgi:hypothetical protein